MIIVACNIEVTLKHTERFHPDLFSTPYHGTKVPVQKLTAAQQ